MTLASGGQRCGQDNGGGVRMVAAAHGPSMGKLPRELIALLPAVVTPLVFFLEIFLLVNFLGQRTNLVCIYCHFKKYCN